MLRNNFRSKSKIMTPSIWEEIIPSLGTGLGISLFLHFVDPPLWLIPIALIVLFVSLTLTLNRIRERESKRR
jgi:hypothetical protein